MTKTIYNLFFPLILLCACGKSSSFTAAIDNKTSKTIKIYFSGTSAYTNQIDSIILEPFQKEIYYNADSHRRVRKFDCDPQIKTEEIVIKISNGIILTKDITKKENWVCETNEKNNFWNSTFVIEENDLRDQ